MIQNAIRCLRFDFWVRILIRVIKLSSLPPPSPRIFFAYYQEKDLLVKKTVKELPFKEPKSSHTKATKVKTLVLSVFVVLLSKPA